MTTKEQKWYARLARAMDMGRVINILYNDRWRIVEPFFLAETRRNTLVANCWHLSGYSSSGFKNSKEKWRNYDLNKIQQLVILKKPFEEEPGYNPDTTLYKRILKFVRFEGEDNNS